MKRSDGFIGNDFHWFIGEVEDIDDRDLFNRVKVRAYGYYELKDKGGPSTEDLPWATVMMPTTSASKEGVGMTHGLMVGSWVVGFFRDGSSAQDPIILGSIQTATNDIVDSPASYIPPEGGKTSINNKITAVHKDDTFRIEHQSGSRIVMDKDGNIDIFASTQTLTQDGGDITIRSGRRGKTKVL